jgi:single-strand DNA-binding protein
MSNMDFAQITVVGRLTADPEVSTTKGGTTVCRFRMAVNRRTGRESERTSFIPISVFGQEAVNCGEYLTKGRSATVMGIFETDEYTDKDGNRRTGFSVIADRVIFGSGGTREDSDTYEAPADTARARGNRGARDYVRGGRGR